MNKRFKERSMRERAAALWFAVIVAVMAFGMALTLAPVAKAAPQNHVIEMGDFFFNQKFITIAADDTVQWHNGGIYTHEPKSNATGAWTAPTVAPSQTSAMITLSVAGNYSYICALHPPPLYNMWGAILVEGSGTAVPEFSGPMFMVAGLLVIMIGMMMLGQRMRKL